MILHIYMERFDLVLYEDIPVNFFKYRRICLNEGRKCLPTSLSTSCVWRQDLRKHVDLFFYILLTAHHFQPAHDAATDTEWQLPEVVLTKFVSPDDERDVLETCRELKIKINT